ncbi:[histone H3]-lysine(4) N-trimethyltransferase [Salvia divinorum]|uniref:[histone H3]-lysine(4) N-trimethyltransferase n=1 Tax=Salvia divinorum TaxID=28513 RepID=A0ABD1I0U9_SALDI
MFTETSFGENAGEIRAASSPNDLNFGIGKLYVSPEPYESTHVRAVESSDVMLRSDVSAADGLLSPFHSINFAEQSLLGNDMTCSTVKSDAIGSISEAKVQGQIHCEGQGYSLHYSSDPERIQGPSTHGDGEAEVTDELERTQQSNDLIVYASSWRNSSRNTLDKPSHNNDSKKSSRRKRSSLSKRTKSSVWGFVDLPTYEENNVLNPCLGNGKMEGKVRGNQGKINVIKDKTGQKAVCKSSTPTGRISLKIKFGNQICGVVNVAENCNILEKSISGLCDKSESKFQEEFPGDMLSNENNVEKVITSDASTLGAHLDVTCSVENKSLSDHQISSHEQGYNLRAPTENMCLDPGTSPDSEVINSIPDAPLCERDIQDLQDSPGMPLERSSGECFANSTAGVSSLSFPKLKSKKGKKATGAETKHKARAPLGLEVNPSPELSDVTGSSKLQAHSSAKGGCKSRNSILDLPRKKGKSSRKKGDKKNFVVKLKIDPKGDASGVLSKVGSHPEAGNQTLPDLGEIGDLSAPPTESEFVSSSGWPNGQNVLPMNAWVLCDECQKWRRIPATLADQIDQTNCGWTCKDNTDKDFADCSIPQEKSNSEINEELGISDDEDAGSTLPKSNKNKSTAAKQSSWTLIKSNLFLHRSRKTQTIDEQVMVCHCKPPSDGRMGCGSKCLNRMLNIECVRGTCPCGERCSNQQFQKRTYAKLKWLRCGKKGFGLQSLQEISEGQFLIEYIGEVLDVHTHEARQKEYALQGHKHFYFMTLNGSEVIDACSKGNLGRFINHSCDPNCRTEKWMVNGEVCVGLFAIRDIKKGEEVTFDYNYVRVFGAAAKKCVCGSPNCRGYIGGDPTNSEVIVQDDSDDEYAEPVMIYEDRDMNHDWTAIMSQSLIVKEIKCRDELEEDRYRIKNVNAAGQIESINSGTSHKRLGVNSDSSGCSKTSTATRVVDMTVHAHLEAESESLLPQSSSPVKLMETSLRSEEFRNNTVSKTLHVNNRLKMSTTTLPVKLQPGAVESKKKLKYGTMRGKEEFSKSGSLAKTYHSSPSIRKGKLKSNVVNDKGTPDGDKLNAVRHKSKKSPGLSLSSHVEAVEGKLNELLDTEGGISKRKDASRGYLKLLFLTAAFGSNGHGEAIQSNRDLSMILDALLKTKSRTVLVDIINKNGLQMLHNIMKRYRKEFIKTPILRKLLKVLEYLATREILTLEHISGGPPRPGVESFKDSMLTLTEHADKQVHQIARNFRDKWIPRSLRKKCFMEMDDAKMEFRQHSTYSKSSVSSGDHRSDRGGKHADSVESCDKQPVVLSGIETSAPNLSSASGCSYGTNGTRTRKRKSRWDTPPEECMHPSFRASLSGDRNQNADNDIPPGFSTPCNDSITPATTCSNALSHQERERFSKLPSGIVLADSQDRFVARMPVSYGIPSSLMQQFGVLGEAAAVWTVAPGLPFHPFPPLPPCASDKGEEPTPAAKCVSEPLEKAVQDDIASHVRYSGKKRTMTEMNTSIKNEHPDFQQEEGPRKLGRN